MRSLSIFRLWALHRLTDAGIAMTAVSRQDELMSREIFGPVLTAYVYDDEKVDDVYQTIRTTSEYGLTGSVFAQDR